MKKFASLGALAAMTAVSLLPIAAYAEAVAPSPVAEGKMIYGANGQSLAPVYRVNLDGSVALIVEGRLLTLAPTSLSDVSGKLTWSRTPGELLH